MAEDGHPVCAVDMFAQTDAIDWLAQNTGERRSARLPRLAPQINAIEFKQIERIEEGLARTLPTERSP